MLRFRPHHFLCTLGFEGKGYSDEFVRGFQKIADSLRERGEAGDQTPIQVVAQTDAICEPCPNRTGKLCATEEKIQKLDQAHAAVLEIRSGDILTWGEAKTRIAEKMTTERFHASCAPCAWKGMGVCEAALNRLKSSHQKKK